MPMVVMEAVIIIRREWVLVCPLCTVGVVMGFLICKNCQAW